MNLELQSKPDDYVGYSEAPAAEEQPYQDPYATSFSDPYQQSKPYQGNVFIVALLITNSRSSIAL